MYVIKSNYCSNNLTLENILNSVGSLTRYMPFNCDTTNWESRKNLRDWIPLEMESHHNSIMKLYSTTLLDDGWRKTPPEDTN